MFKIDHTVSMLIFIKSIGIGFLLGLVYGLMSFVRINTANHKIVVFAEDILFFCIGVFATFMFTFEVNYGRIRLYILAGELIGFLLYFSIPASFVRKSAGIIMTIKKFFVKK